MSDPYDVERVQSRFMVMKNFYIYREQFPLILAYAVTIYTCQGLSLDCAIVDLSDKVFSAGMAYVALSRVRSLARLHLSAFDPASIIVSTSCLKEVNRLRETFRKDLPQYDLPLMSKTGRIATKRKLTGSNKVGNPSKKARLAKATKVTKVPPKTKGTQSLKRNDGKSNKKQSDSCVITGASNISRDRNRTWPFIFNCVDEEYMAA